MEKKILVANFVWNIYIFCNPIPARYSGFAALKMSEISSSLTW